VQAFFPGQLGGQALAEVLTGATNPSGRLPVSVPADASGQPGTYLSQPLGRRTQVSNIDPTHAFPFGHGLSYTSFDWDARLATGDAWPVDGEAVVEVDVANTGDAAGADVVQLYLHDPVAQVTRPVVRLVGYARVDLAPGERARVTFTVPADVTAFTGTDGRRVVEPGDVELRVSRSSADHHTTLTARLDGPLRTVDHTRRLVTEVAVLTGADAPEVVTA
jgi:beta-glucosidase